MSPFVSRNLLRHDSFRRPAERIGNLAVRRLRLGKDEIPGANDLCFDALRGGGISQRKRESGKRDLNDLHNAPSLLVRFRPLRERVAAYPFFELLNRLPTIRYYEYRSLWSVRE